MPYKSVEEQKKYLKEYRIKHLEHKNKIYRDWYSKPENKQRVLEKNKEWRKRTHYKSHTNSSDNKLMAINLLRQRDGNICGHCNMIIINDFSIDHVLPRCIGGKDNAENLRLVHKLCNIRRERSTYREVQNSL
jgi:hypothetical protein